MIKKYFDEFKSYIFIGLANTILTFSVVFIMISFGISNYFSNFVGFSFGMILSFLLNSRLTFKVSSNKYKNFPLYILVLLFSYVLNIIALYTCLNYFSLSNILSQFLSLSIYVLVSFLLLKALVFNKADPC